MAARTVPTKPIRFNVQPPFLSKAAKRACDLCRHMFTNRLPPPGKTTLPEGQAPSYPESRDTVKPQPSGIGVTAAMLALTRSPVNSRAHIPRFFSCRAEFAPGMDGGKTTPSASFRTAVPQGGAPVLSQWNEESPRLFEAEGFCGIGGHGHPDLRGKRTRRNATVAAHGPDRVGGAPRAWAPTQIFAERGDGGLGDIPEALPRFFTPDLVCDFKLRRSSRPSR
jgi:hypothetical protein